MKSIALVLVAFFGSQLALASQVPNPLLQLEAHSGLVPPPLSYSKQCRVHRDRVLITLRKAQSAPTTVSKRLRFNKEVRSVRDIVRLTEQARRGHVEKHDAPTDGDSYHYQGIQTVGAGAPRFVELKQYYSAFFQENTSPAAKKLVRFLDLNCK
jgi:hypothetical protein